jgi:hypothetical protein
MAMAVNVTTQFYVMRRSGSLLASLVAGFGVGGAVVLLLDYLALPTGIPLRDGVLIALANLLAYACFGYVYFHFANLGETARRIRIMREIDQSPYGLTAEEIIARYNAQSIIEKRLGRLLSKHQIIQREGRFFYAKGQVYYIAKMLSAAKRCIYGMPQQHKSGQ